MFGSRDDQADNSQMMAPPMPAADQSTYGMSSADATAPTAPPVDPYAASVQTSAPVAAPQDTSPVIQPAYSGYDTPSADPTNSPVPVDSATASPSQLPDVNHQDLFAIKQEALQHLGPMVGSLEQSPEEKFKTLMMMIQASDDHTKLKEAFEMAKQITDDKARAQALLDIINEINYFTQSPSAN